MLRALARYHPGPLEFRMRVLVALVLLVGCADTSTPEAFVTNYLDRQCEAMVDCGVFESVGACMADTSRGWYADCVSDLLPAWDPQEGAACLADAADYVCGTREDQGGSPCDGICRP